jgi:hypothetical protein
MVEAIYRWKKRGKNVLFKVEWPSLRGCLFMLMALLMDKTFKGDFSLAHWKKV